MSCALVLGSLGPAAAADRALLIGVGDYREPGIGDLPGIDLDVSIMERVAARIGFDGDEVRALRDADATLGGVDRAMREWLVDGVSADDRVLIYFSGHGAQIRDRNGDEADGLDEFLVLHDFAVDDDGNASGALLDDRFYQLLERIPTDDVLLIVDACHSGSGYKSLAGLPTGADGGVGKTLPIGALPAAGADPFTVADKGTDPRFAAIMAAADDQVAIATPRGSLFTLGIEAAVEAAAVEGVAPTPRDLTEGASRYIVEALANAPDDVFDPQLGGNTALADRPLPLASVNPHRDELQAFVGAQAPLEVSTDRSVFPLGDLGLRVSVEVPAAGWLNIVTVDPDGTAVVLYPNRFDRDNRVEPGTLAVPTEAMDFDLRADGPVGEHLVAAIWSAEPVDLYEAGHGERDADGRPLEGFARLSEYGTRAFEAVARERTETPVRAGAVVLEVTP